MTVIKTDKDTRLISVFSPEEEIRVDIIFRIDNVSGEPCVIQNIQAVCIGRIITNQEVSEINPFTRRVYTLIGDKPSQ